MTFGTTTFDDHHELEALSGPNWTELLMGITELLYNLEAALAAIKRQQTELRAAGMWPGVPIEIWEDRDNTGHGEKRYLRLSFPKGALSGGRRKLYIGCKPEKITAARQKAARRRQWEALQEERVKLERFLRMTRSSLDRVAGQVSSYRIPDDLGLELPDREASAGPSELPELPRESSPEWVRIRPRVEYDL